MYIISLNDLPRLLCLFESNSYIISESLETQFDCCGTVQSVDIGAGLLGGESKHAANSGKNQLKQKIVPLKPTRHFVYLFGDKV